MATAAGFSDGSAMQIVIFGASGMIGQAVLRECRADPDITRVLLLGRSRVEASHAKVDQHVMPDLSRLDAARHELTTTR